MHVKSSAHPRRQACSKTVLLLLLDFSFPLNIILWPFLPNYHFHVLDCGKLAFHNRPWKLSLIRAGAEKEDCLLWTSIDGEFFMHKYLSSETTVSLSWLLSPAAPCSAAALVSLHPLLLSSAQHLQTPLVPLPFLNASHGVTSVIFCCSMQQKLNQDQMHLHLLGITVLISKTCWMSRQYLFTGEMPRSGNDTGSIKHNQYVCIHTIWQLSSRSMTFISPDHVSPQKALTSITDEWDWWVITVFAKNN